MLGGRLASVDHSLCTAIGVSIEMIASAAPGCGNGGGRAQRASGVACLCPAYALQAAAFDEFSMSYFVCLTQLDVSM